MGGIGEHYGRPKTLRKLSGKYANLRWCVQGPKIAIF